MHQCCISLCFIVESSHAVLKSLFQLLALSNQALKLVKKIIIRHLAVVAEQIHCNLLVYYLSSIILSLPFCMISWDECI